MCLGMSTYERKPNGGRKMEVIGGGIMYRKSLSFLLSKGIKLSLETKGRIERKGEEKKKKKKEERKRNKREKKFLKLVRNHDSMLFWF